MRTRIIVILLAVCGLVVSSCHHLTLNDPATGVYLSINTTVGSKAPLNEEILAKAPISARKRVTDEMPGTFYVMMYDATSHHLVASEFLPPEGGFIDAPNGTYDVLVYGYNPESVTVEDMEVRSMARARTAARGTVLHFSKNSDDEESEEAMVHIQYPIIYEPEHVYSGIAENVRIYPQSDERGVTVIHIDTESVCDSCTLQILDVRGAERIRHITCYVTGQVPYRYLWDRRFPDELAALPVDPFVDVNEGTVTGCFNTFGKHPIAYSNIFVNIAVTNEAGGLYQWIYDVTEQFNNPDNTEHNIVLVNPIIIPESEAGGFMPSVSDWESEITHVPL